MGCVWKLEKKPSVKVLNRSFIFNSIILLLYKYIPLLSIGLCIFFYILKLLIKQLYIFMYLHKFRIPKYFIYKKGNLFIDLVIVWAINHKSNHLTKNIYIFYMHINGINGIIGRIIKYCVLYLFKPMHYCRKNFLVLIQYYIFRNFMYITTSVFLVKH